MATDTMPVADIKVRDGFNVRQNGHPLAEDEETIRLAESVKLVGVKTPVTVDIEGYLVAGHRRLAAATLAGVTDIPFVVEEGDAKDRIAVHALENIARLALSPAEEAEAIDRMLKEGFTSEGAAQVLGMSKSLVTRRHVMLQIPEDLRALLWGRGGKAALDAAQPVAAVVSKEPKLAAVMLHAEQTRNQPPQPEPSQEEIDAARDRAYEEGFEDDYYLDEDDAYRDVTPPSINDIVGHPIEYLRTLRSFYTPTDSHKLPRGTPKWPASFVIHTQGQRFDDRRLDELNVPAAVRESFGKARTRARDAFSYTSTLEVTEADMDAARAAGVTVVLGEGVEILFDAKWLHERVKSDMLPRLEQQVDEAVTSYEERVAERQKNQVLPGALSSEQRADDSKEKAARTREAEKGWKPRAAVCNEELGAALLTKFGSVTVDAKIAKIFAEASLGGRPPANAGYGDMPSNRTAAKLAAAGLRYVMPGWQTVVPTPTKANPNKTKTEFLELVEAEAKLWEWFDKAKTPEEIFGRALVIHTAAMWANEHVLPMSKRSPLASSWVNATRTELPRDVGERVRKLTEPKIPAAVKKLLKEIREFDSSKP